MANPELPPSNDDREFHSPLSPDQEVMLQALAEDLEAMPPPITDNNTTPHHIVVSAAERARQMDHGEDDEWGTAPKGIGQ